MIFKYILLLVLLGTTRESLSAARADPEGHEADSQAQVRVKTLSTFEDLEEELQRRRAAGDDQAKEFATWLGETLILQGSSTDNVNRFMERLGAGEFYHVDFMGEDHRRGYIKHLQEKRLVQGLQTVLTLGKDATESFLKYVFTGTIDEKPQSLADGWTQAHLFTPGNCYRSDAEDRATSFPLHFRVGYSDQQKRSADGQFWEAIKPSSSRVGWREEDSAYRSAFAGYPHSVAVLNLHNQISTGDTPNPFTAPMGRFVVNMFSDLSSRYFLDVRDATIFPAYKELFADSAGSAINEMSARAWNIFIRTIWDQMELGRLPLNLFILASGVPNLTPLQEGESRPLPLFAGASTDIFHLLAMGFEPADYLRGKFEVGELDVLYKDRYLLGQLATDLRVIDDVRKPPRAEVVPGSEKEVTLEDGRTVRTVASKIVGGVQASPKLRAMYKDFEKERARLAAEQPAAPESAAGAGVPQHQEE